MTTERLVDARGLPCPEPVIQAKAAMREGATLIRVIVDSDTAAGNVARAAQKAGWRVEEERRAADDIHLLLRAPAAGPAEASAVEVRTPAGPTVLLVKSDRMGVGDDQLGEVLIRAFFHTLTELDQPPQTLIFLNGGVKLTTAGSPVLEDLRALEERGVAIWSCGTCLNFFGLTDTLEAGGITNMYSIAEMLMGAGKIISP